MEKICCVTGHRDIPDDQEEKIKAALEREIEKAAADGYTGFMTGFEVGVDQTFAELVVGLQKKNPDLKLIAVLPSQKQAEDLQAGEQTKALMAACAEVKVIDGKEQSAAYTRRNRFMVEHADRVIAVYDGRETGGTVKMIRLVHQMRKELREIPVGEIHLPWQLKGKRK